MSTCVRLPHVKKETPMVAKKKAKKHAKKAAKKGRKKARK